MCIKRSLVDEVLVTIGFSCMPILSAIWTSDFKLQGQTILLSTTLKWRCFFFFFFSVCLVYGWCRKFHNAGNAAIQEETKWTDIKMNHITRSDWGRLGFGALEDFFVANNHLNILNNRAAGLWTGSSAIEFYLQLFEFFLATMSGDNTGKISEISQI